MCFLSGEWVSYMSMKNLTVMKIVDAHNVGESVCSSTMKLSDRGTVHKCRVYSVDLFIKSLESKEPPSKANKHASGLGFKYRCPKSTIALSGEVRMNIVSIFPYWCLREMRKKRKMIVAIY